MKVLLLSASVLVSLVDRLRMLGSMPPALGLGDQRLLRGVARRAGRRRRAPLLHAAGQRRRQRLLGLVGGSTSPAAGARPAAADAARRWAAW